jgi:hypothetical protein
MEHRLINPNIFKHLKPIILHFHFFIGHKISQKHFNLPLPRLLRIHAQLHWLKNNLIKMMVKRKRAMYHVVELVLCGDGTYSLGLSNEFFFALEKVREMNNYPVFALEDCGELLAEFVDDFGVFLRDGV